MDRLIYTAMTGAKQAFVQQAGVAHNLANAATTGYRAMEHKFRAVPVQGEGAPTRAFVADASVADVFDQGPLQATGRPLDVAVLGAGWIAVETPDGGEATFNAWTPRTDGDRIDWIFATPSFEIISVTIDRHMPEGVLPSDHYPVIATLRAPPNTSAN